MRLVWIAINSSKTCKARCCDGFGAAGPGQGCGNLDLLPLDVAVQNVLRKKRLAIAILVLLPIAHLIHNQVMSQRMTTNWRIKEDIEALNKRIAADGQAANVEPIRFQRLGPYCVIICTSASTLVTLAISSVNCGACLVMQQRMLMCRRWYGASPRMSGNQDAMRPRVATRWFPAYVDAITIGNLNERTFDLARLLHPQNQALNITAAVMYPYPDTERRKTLANAIKAAAAKY